MARWKKHGTTSNFTLTILHYFTSVFQFIGLRVYPLKSIFEVIEYRIWLHNKFGKITYYKNKRRLLVALIEYANKDSEVRAPEGGGSFDRIWGSFW